MCKGPLYDHAIERFHFDRWESVSVAELNPGDWIYVKNATHVLHEKPSLKDGRIVLRANRLSDAEGPIRLLVGEYANALDHVAMAMDYTNSSLNEFGDGTGILIDLETGPGAVFSPRLPLAELEVFCRENIALFEAHFNQNETALDQGKIVAIEPFWRSTDHA